MRWLPKKKVIYGCEARGDSQSPYLTRYALFDLFGHAAYVHVFHRSDSPEHHDHPWGFISLILWRGYEEETLCRHCKGQGWIIFETWWISEPDMVRCPYCNGLGNELRRAWPGMVLFRPATWRHRVVLIDNKPAVTLVIRSKYVRQWGFFTAKGWQHWKAYFEERGC